MTISRRRQLMVGAFLTAWALVVAARMFQVSILRHDHYLARAERQHERTIELTPVRGSIRDARGRVLAKSVPASSIYADPQAIEDPNAVAKALASVRGLDLDRAGLARKLSGRGEFAWIARQVPDKVAAEVRSLALPGIYEIEENRRAYPKAHLASTILGFVGVDGHGLAGAEHSFDQHLGGRPGRVTVLRDAKRGVYLVGGEGKNSAVDGLDVQLTIDEVVQHFAETTLADTARKHRAKSGSVVVMNPHDGRVLALASWPDYDPNRFREFSQDHWRNRPVQDLYEPGSTFKIITAAAGLEEGRVTPSQVIDCGNGSILIANRAIRENAGHRYGLLSFEDVLAQSSNVGTIKVALALGPSTLHRHVREFGFGEKTGIELPGESQGLLRDTKNWSALSNAVISIGQEIGVTPLQLTRAVAAVANGGTLVTPRILERVVDRDGRVRYEPAPGPTKRVVSERTAAVLNEMLKTVVVRGTGKNAAVGDHVVAGKTGTAQKADRGRYAPDKRIASFIGYAPADRPEVVILVVIDEPSVGRYGGEVAAPAFRAIAESTLRYLRVEPSIPGRELGVELPKMAAFSHEPSGMENAKGIVPDLTGLDAREAIARATAAGLRVRASGSGFVMSQEPPPGESAKVVAIRLDAERPARKDETEVSASDAPRGVPVALARVAPRGGTE
jgi:cell division protein FtsI (penicillin-binding protein 3)